MLRNLHSFPNCRLTALKKEAWLIFFLLANSRDDSRKCATLFWSSDYLSVDIGPCDTLLTKNSMQSGYHSLPCSIARQIRPIHSICEPDSEAFCLCDHTDQVWCWRGALGLPGDTIYLRVFCRAAAKTVHFTHCRTNLSYLIFDSRRLCEIHKSSMRPDCNRHKRARIFTFHSALCDGLKLRASR